MLNSSKTDFEIQRANYSISTDPKKLNIPLIHHYLSELSYWSQHIPYEIVEASVRGSLCFGVYEDQKQIGFARVISDCATFAYIADVFILPESQGQGLGKWLIGTVLSHPELQDLKRWMLFTEDAHDLYRKFGFTELPKPYRVMEKTNFTEYPEPKSRK